MKLTIPALLAGTLAGAIFAAGPTTADTRPTVPGDTIIRISGSNTDGFRMTHADGHGSWVPPLEGALSECDDYYNRRLEQVRCHATRIEEYQKYRAVKHSLKYYRR